MIYSRIISKTPGNSALIRPETCIMQACPALLFTLENSTVTQEEFFVDGGKLCQ